MEERIIGPWVRRTRRTAYQNPWITIWHDEVTRPDGEPGIYGVVHFANLAVGVVPVDDDGRILLVGQYRYTLDDYSWEIPEGGVPFDEDPLDGARRELREETGFEAGEWHELVRLATSNSVTDEVGVIYVARQLTEGMATPDGTEELVSRWASLDESLAMIDRGEITDAMSQIGLLRFALERSRGASPVTAGNPLTTTIATLHDGALDGP
jgi:8-oxo-dGTP pyrophosphatase MutT (NUDIX family)